VTDEAGNSVVSHYALLTNKRLLEDVGLPPQPMYGLPVSNDSGPEKKRRKTTTEQQVKRHKYDVLKAFFRVYFVESKEGMVLKDTIFNLYAKKIPLNQRIARNAMYRHMWAFFKHEAISAFQSNYREYIKGIKLVANDVGFPYEDLSKEIDLLQSMGAGDIFDFNEEELEKPDKPLTPPEQLTAYQGTSNSGGSGSNGGGSISSMDDTVLAVLEQLEQQAKTITTTLRDLKMKLKKNEGQSP